MTKSSISQRAETAADAATLLLDFFYHSRWSQRFGKPGICDFTVGNPHEKPSAAFLEALQRWSVPQDPYWYAYKMNEEPARVTVAASLQEWRGISFDPQDIFLTNGATGALTVALHTIADPRDEVIFITPSWFLYDTMIRNAGAVPVRVKAQPGAFELDPAAVEEAITPATRAVIINSPNNPTGRVYSGSTLAHLGEVLTRASRKHGRTIYLISDEAYARIVFDGKSYPTPCIWYDCTLLVYTYGKVLLTPGQRIGFLALPPGMPERPAIRKAILMQQMLNGWAFPNALLQHALADLDRIPVDLSRLQRKRDCVVGALREMGYTLPYPEGTFYCLVRSPLADDVRFAGLLAEEDVFCIPGTLQEAPGYFRVCLTATEAMIERALPIFERVRRQLRGTGAAS